MAAPNNDFMRRIISNTVFKYSFFDLCTVTEINPIWTGTSTAKWLPWAKSVVCIFTERGEMTTSRSPHHALSYTTRRSSELIGNNNYVDSSYDRCHCVC